MKKLIEKFKTLHHDERGEIPVGALLLIGLIAIPLVIILVTFMDQITEWVNEQFKKLKGTAAKDSFK
ncbi:MAG: Flp pilus assembly pilin Flp [Planctomycetota bacterium]|jgi:Flp pilus assembly pilin Flp